MSAPDPSSTSNQPFLHSLSHTHTLPQCSFLSVIAQSRRLITAPLSNQVCVPPQSPSDSHQEESLTNTLKVEYIKHMSQSSLSQLDFFLISPFFFFWVQIFLCFDPIKVTFIAQTSLVQVAHIFDRHEVWIAAINWCETGHEFSLKALFCILNILCLLCLGRKRWDCMRFSWKESCDTSCL